MTSRTAPICGFCVHFRRSSARLVCAAFPDGIPEEILSNEEDHRAPVEGDHGIIFREAPNSGFDPGIYDIILKKG